MFDRSGLGDVIETYGRVVRVVIAGHKGSTPRETGAAMLVHADGIASTIGGGRLELDAMNRAHQLLADAEMSGGHRLRFCANPWDRPSWGNVAVER